jgi:hypothetical protein
VIVVASSTTKALPSWIVRIVVPMLAALTLLCGEQLAAAQSVSSAFTDLATNPDAKVRAAAARILSKSRDPRAIAACARALGSDTDASVREASTKALLRLVKAGTAPLDWVTALSALSNAGANDKDASVKKRASFVHKWLLRRAPPVVTAACVTPPAIAAGTCTVPATPTTPAPVTTTSSP